MLEKLPYKQARISMRQTWTINLFTKNVFLIARYYF